MKFNKKWKLLTIVMLVVLLTTGCTKSLEDKDGNIVKNPVTGQSITENILCKPTDKETIKIYEKNDVKIEKLPDCDNYEFNTGKDEGLWTNVFVKPLAWLILTIGNLVKNYGLSLVLTSLAIRMVAIPITKKTAMQSELLAKAKPELDKLEKKYENKQDQESLLKKNQEMLMIYQKYNISPASGCLYAFLQLPIFIAFLEAINRVPAIFEDKFLGFQLGTTPWTAFQNGDYKYLLLVVILGLVTYFSFKLNVSSAQNDQTRTMNKTMVIMIIVMSLFMTAALDIYWLTSNLFTVAQNLLVKRRKDVNGKV
ncbi:MAG: YidC/Oxa1 family membrane protein insertase [Bacilli bacterium]|nr:YidC/Oxa1 family membrane protein insertase [Bacilli bacterium]MBQ7105884.1 YidC/Oxa1 family membrane protein insertase [Bacilli bacterium]